MGKGTLELTPESLYGIVAKEALFIAHAAPKAGAKHSHPQARPDSRTYLRMLGPYAEFTQHSQ